MASSTETSVNSHQSFSFTKTLMMSTDNESPSSTRHEEILAERVDSTRLEDIAIQVENDVIASVEKIYEDNESITRIPRVPKSLRQGANDPYDPQVISIGPYHWGKPQLEANEKHKRRYLVQFLNRIPGRCLRDYVEEIKALEPRLRSCYDKDIHEITSKNFVEMMLVDGCFIIEFILQKVDPGQDHPGETWFFDSSLIANDLYLLENQLPFFLLQHIYDIATATTKENLAYPSSFIQVALEFSSLMEEEDFEPFSTPITLEYQLPKTIHHLMHLCHTIYACYYSVAEPMFEIPSSESTCLFQMVRFDVFATSKRAVRVLTIPSATELHDLGIKFEIDKSPNPFHIKFHRGVMEISPLFLTYVGAREVLNNVAFERFYSEVEPFFIPYFKFMDLLVNTSKDVVLLRKYDIIHHEFGSDEELALFFSQLMKGISNDRSPLLTEMYDKVNEYCNIRRHRWRASLIRDYCSSPWSTLGLVVAFLLLSFTFIQSYMSLHSYFRPPRS